MLYFITEGNNVRIKDGDNDFRVLHNTSNCINWTVYTDKIDLSIDEVTFDQMNPTHIYFDGVAASTSAGVVNSLKGMFSNLGSKAKVYRAFISQSNTDNPTATVLENTLGTVTLSRVNIGEYRITWEEGIFENLKTFPTPLSYIDIAEQDYTFNFVQSSGSGSNLLDFRTNDVSNLSTPTEADGYLDKFPIQILVYP